MKRSLLFYRCQPKLLLWVLVVMCFFVSQKNVCAQNGYVANGNASYTSGDNSWVLTPNAGGQGGSVWYQNFMSLNANFDFTFQVYLGDNDGGADGIAFVMQPNSTGAGGSGGGLGYQGITPSLAVEFDTYQNNDPYEDHISLQPNGNVNTLEGSLRYATVPNMEDGQWHTTRMVWDATSKNLKVYYDGGLKIDYTGDIVNNIFGGSPQVYWGFTGATGGASNLQKFKVISTSFSEVAGALHFDGANDYVEINNPFYQFGKEITVEWSAKVESGPVGSGIGQSVAGVDNNSTSNVWLMHSNGNGSISFYINDNGAWRAAHANSLPAGWHRWTGVANPSGVYFYMDGILVASSTDGIKNGIKNLSNSVVHLGKDVRYTNSRFLRGSIDEVRIWNRALCKEEVESYSAGGELTGTQTGLEGYYKFNQGFVNGNNTGISSVTDASGKNRHGSLRNMTLTGSTSNFVAGYINGPAPVYLAPEINLKGSGQTILAGDLAPSNTDGTDFGIADTGVNTVKTFTIENTGSGVLTLSSIVINGANASNFTLGNMPTSISAGGTANFTVTFNASTPGVYNATVTVNNNDCDESVYSFAIKAEAKIACIAPSIANLDSYIQRSTVSDGCQTAVTYPLSVNGTPAPNVTYSFSGATSGTGTGTGSGQAFNQGLTNVTVTATNSCGTVSQSFQVLVKDETKPIAKTKNITVYLGANGKATVTPEDVDAGSTDNCGAVTLSLLNSGIICGTATEGGTVFLQAPAGATIDGIKFASYGTPNGSCGNFTIGGCHSSQSLSQATAYLVGKNSASIPATNTVFGDPCGGTPKRLYIEATYTGTGVNNTFDCSNVGVNTVTLLVTDANGNVTTQTATVTVVDNTAPTITAPVAKSISTDAAKATASNVALGTPVTADNCSVTSVTNNAPTTFALGTTTVTWTVTDASGNKVTATQEVTVNDNEAPVFTAPQPNATIALDAVSGTAVLANYIGSATVTDNSGKPVVVTQEPTAGTALVQNVPTTVTLTATDAVGLTTTQTFTVTATDQTAPIAKAKNITVPLDANGKASITPEQLNDGSSDNVGPVSFSFGQARLSEGFNSSTYNSSLQPVLTNNWVSGVNGTYNFNGQLVLRKTASGRTYISTTASDYITKDFSMTLVYDNTNVIGGGDILTFVGIGDPSITDGNKEPSTGIFLRHHNNGNAGADGIWSRLNNNAFTYNQGLGALREGLHRIKVEKVGNIITFYKDQGNTGTFSSAIASFDISTSQANQLNASNSYLFFGSGSTNFQVNSLEISSAGNSGTYACNNVGSNPVTLAVTDGSGNVSTAQATVTVVDNIAPAITGPSDIKVFATSAAGSVVNYETPVGTDNCSATTTRTAGLASGATFPIGVNTVTYTATDASGNSTEHSFTVTVEGLAPEVVAPANMTVSNDAGKCGANVMFAATETTAIPASTITYSVAPGSFFNVGTHSVTATATNAVGSSSATFTITVTDNEKPKAIAQGLTVQLNAAGNASITASAINNGSSDNCGIASVSIDKSLFTCANVGDNTVTLTVTDIHGNVSSVTAVVKVEDKVAPVVVTRNITIQLDASGNASITAADINNGSSDACGIASYSLNKSSFDCSNVGANTVNLTVTDVNGNVSSQTAVVTVEDKVAPVAMARNITVQLNAEGKVSITPAMIDNGSSDACGIQSLIISKMTFDCANVGQNAITLTVTDNNGNLSQALAIVTVEDHVAPVVVTRNITVQLDANGKATITPAMVNNGSSDACGIMSLVISKTSFDCSNVGVNEVILTVTDMNGNVSSGTAMVTVEDTVAPVVIARNITIQLNANGNASITTAMVNNGSTDACGIASYSLSKSSFDCSNVGANTVTLTVTDVNGNSSSKNVTVTVKDEVAPIAITKKVTVTLNNGTASITASDVDGGSTDACGIASLVVNKTTFDCSEIGKQTVTLTVTDVNGNVSTATAIVNVVGVIPAPAIAVSRTDNTNTGVGTEKTIFLGYGAQSLTLTASNATSAAGASTYKWSPATGLSSTTVGNPVFTPTSEGTYTFTVTATNEFGCTSSTQETIRVIDARCGSGNSGKLDKVLVCHNGKEICIAPSAVQAHLAHGCSIGNCSSQIKPNTRTVITTTIADALGLEVYPNPVSDKANIEFTLVVAGEYSLKVYDMRGALVKVVSNGSGKANEFFSFEQEVATLQAGVYIVQLTTEGGVATKRIVVRQ